VLPLRDRYILWFLVGFDFPRQFWIDFYPLRWILLVPLVVYLWWNWPLHSGTIAKIRYGGRAPR
jgi:hypothetical protein